MGFVDRLNDRDVAGPPAGGRPPSVFSQAPVTAWLIGINVAVYFLEGLFGLPFTWWGHFSAGRVLVGLEVWRFFSFQFLHSSLTHLFVNMFTLYVFGPLVEGYLGSRRYVAFYLLCGAAGAVLYLALWWLNVLNYRWDSRLVGASAGIFGVLVAAARVAPHARIMLLFPPIPMKLRTFAWLLIGVAVATIAYAHASGAPGTNAGGEAAHLGGAALGALLIRRHRRLALADRLGGGPPRHSTSNVQPPTSNLT